ncbi:MAG: phenylacetate--CoA ligase family protein [Pyrinomonadaceae bacterium]
MSLRQESIYLRLPVLLQNAACSIEGWRIHRRRYGYAFHRALQLAEERTYWPRERLIEYQGQRIRELMVYCAKHVPYYRRRFREWGVPVSRIGSLADLSRYLPVLTKDEVRSHYSEFISDAVPKRQITHLRTSGTTGAGMRLAVVPETNHQLWAYWWRYRRWHGIEPGNWCGYFGGRSVVPSNQTTQPFWRVNLFGKQVLFSAYHATHENLDSYLGALDRHHISWLHGYPSILTLLAERSLAVAHRLRRRIRWITIGSENLLPQQAEIIEEAFGVKPVQHYCQAEAVCNISECPHGRLHVDEDFSAVEFVPSGIDRASRIIGTSFVNPAAPLLRYDTQDIATASPENESCSCGRHGRLVESIDGRKEDYVVLSDGSRVGRMDHVFKNMLNIREAQIYQREVGKVVIRVVRGSEYREEDKQKLLAEAKGRLGDRAEIDVQYVEKLGRTRTGKLRLVISELPGATVDSNRQI